MSRQTDSGRETDRGTQLGATSRLLESVFGAVLGCGAALRRAARSVAEAARRIARSEALATFLRAVAAPFNWMLQALATLVDKVFTAIARAIEVAARVVGALVVRLGRVLVRIVRAITRVCLVLSLVLALVLKPVIAVVLAALIVVGRVLVRAGRLVGAAIRALGRWSMAVLDRVAAALSPLWRAIARSLRRAATMIVGVCAAVARWSARSIAVACSWVLRRAGYLRSHVRAGVARLRQARLRVTYDIGVAAVRARQRRRPVSVEIAIAEQWTPSAAPPEVPFDTVVHQNEYLARDVEEVHAIITVTAHGDAAATPERSRAAEVILLDCSGSMGQPWRKLREARRAAASAIDTMRDGTFFAVVRGTDDAEVVFPADGTMVRASHETRIAAKEALRLLWPEGGTAMSTWLTCARDLFATQPHTLRHAILLTDGRNESDTAAAMTNALDACAGIFQCDCRGVGAAWDVAELREIAFRLDGSLDMVADPADLADDFAAMTETAMTKRVDGAKLRVWIPQGGAVRYLKQMSPEIRDLTDRGAAVDPLTDDYSIGAWGNETRDYHLCVRVPAGEIGSELLASRVRLVVGDRVVAKALVKAIWTDDEQLSALMDRSVAHYTGQAELADNVRLGLEALRAGDESAATNHLGRAVRIAMRSGNVDTLALLEQVAVIEDERDGKVRLRDRVDPADEMLLETRSERTVPARA
jgi:hypothetical protein